MGHEVTGKIHLIGDTVGVQVTSVTTTSHGRLVFAKLAHP